MDNVSTFPLHAETEMNFLPSSRVGIEPDISDLGKKKKKDERHVIIVLTSGAEKKIRTKTDNQD